MRATSMELQIGTKTVQCLFDEEQRVLWVDKHLYDNVAAFADALPEALSSENLLNFCRLANFLARGFEYRVILDIAAFQTSYADQILQEAQFPDIMPTMISAYGIYDTSTMHSPLLEEGTLRFFVENDYTHVPYLVTMELSSIHDKARTTYKLLPFSM